MNILKAANRVTVDADDYVAGLDPGMFGGAAPLDFADLAGVNGWPNVMKRAASTTTAKIKFAAGPAATIAARCPSRLW